MPSTHRRAGGRRGAGGCPDVQPMDARRTPGHARRPFKFNHLPLARLVHFSYPTIRLDAP